VQVIHCDPEYNQQLLVAVPAMQVPLNCKRYPVLHERHVEVLDERHEAQLDVALQPVVRTVWVQVAVPVYPVPQAVQVTEVAEVPLIVHAEHPVTPAITVVPVEPAEQETQVPRLPVTVLTT
jgi:hypothetical protein